MDNKSGTTNKYGANNNKSGATCCCGCVSIETGTYVAAMTFFATKMIGGILLLTMWDDGSSLAIGDGLGFVVVAFACLLVIFAQHARNPWLFVPYLILGVVEMIKIGYEIYKTINDGCETFLSQSAFGNEWTVGNELPYDCSRVLASMVWSILVHVWFYSIIFRGFLALKEVESRRSRPHF